MRHELIYALDRTALAATGSGTYTGDAEVVKCVASNVLDGVADNLYENIFCSAVDPNGAWLQIELTDREHSLAAVRASPQAQYIT